MNEDSNNQRAKGPAFQKVIEFLRAQIQFGKLQEHAALPSERALGEQFNISRMTARRALLALEMEGLAYSSDRRGRFVSPQRLTYDISKTVSFSEHAEEGALGLSIKLVSQGMIEATPQIAAKLSIEEGRELYTYTRLFSLKGHPAFIEEEFAIADLFPDMFSHSLEQSTTRLMEQEYNMPAHSGDISIRMRALNEAESKLLNLPTYHAGIELEQVILDHRGQPFCFGRQLWRGELAEFTAHAVVRNR
ncbi:transcriptional regulator, GntR family protein [Roseobacter sp. SK209-2-6]|uniref:GntR family transcriptional regulator n=1 Tax=Roseobacter sp. SK209-2-6 TaxID=388739 RepID=UPI0000F3F651|nr:GntR family transcriptional regulator [Roseobacter sp. SK209-2-6]EBA18039.1 transcriptional regulator, GntR family protein [Roseobacter sp. SK209-2-6]